MADKPKTAEELIEELEDYGCLIDIYDPWVDSSELNLSHKREIIPNPISHTLPCSACE